MAARLDEGAREEEVEPLLRLAPGPARRAEGRDVGVRATRAASSRRAAAPREWPSGSGAAPRPRGPRAGRRGAGRPGSGRRGRGRRRRPAARRRRGRPRARGGGLRLARPRRRGSRVRSSITLRSSRARGGRTRARRASRPSPRRGGPSGRRSGGGRRPAGRRRGAPGGEGRRRSTTARRRARGRAGGAPSTPKETSRRSAFTGRPRTKPRPEARARKGFAVFAMPSAARDWATTARTAPATPRKAKRRRSERPVRSQSQRRSGESVASRGSSTKRWKAPRIVARPRAPMTSDGRPRRTTSARNAARLPRSRSAAKRPAKPPARSAERAAWRSPAARRPAKGPERRGRSRERKRPLLEGVEARAVAEEARLGAEEVGAEDEVPPLREAVGRGPRVEEVVEARGERSRDDEGERGVQERGRGGAPSTSRRPRRGRGPRGRGGRLPSRRDPGERRDEGEELEEVLREEPEAVAPRAGGRRVGLGPQAVVQAVHVEEAACGAGRRRPRGGAGPVARQRIHSARPSQRRMTRCPPSKRISTSTGQATSPSLWTTTVDSHARPAPPGRARRGGAPRRDSPAGGAARRDVGARDGVVDGPGRGPPALDEVARLGPRHLADDAEEVARRRVAEGEPADVLLHGGEEGLLAGRPRDRLEEERRARVGVRPDRRVVERRATSRGASGRSARRRPGRGRPATPPRGAAASGNGAGSGRRTPPRRGSARRRSASRPSRRPRSRAPRRGAPRSPRRRRASPGTTGARARGA